MRTPFTGCGTALVTPFTQGGALDEAGVRRLAQRQIDAGIHFLVPCGTTGENPTLTAAERVRVVEIVVDEADGQGAGARRRRRLRHAGSDRSRRARWRARAPTASCRSTPYYNKPTQEGLFQHYRAIAESTPLPIVVYNVPGRTGVQRRVGDAGAARRRSRTSSASRKRRATSRRCARSVSAVPGGLHRAVRRRCADAAADGGRRARHHLGRVERDSGGDGADGRSRRARRLRRARATVHTRISAADAGQLRRVEPGSGEGGDGGDGAARGGLPPADGAARAGLEEQIGRVLKELGLPLATPPTSDGDRARAATHDSWRLPHEHAGV